MPSSNDQVLPRPEVNTPGFFFHLKDGAGRLHILQAHVYLRLLERRKKEVEREKGGERSNEYYELSYTS